LRQKSAKQQTHTVAKRTRLQYCKCSATQDVYESLKSDVFQYKPENDNWA